MKETLREENISETSLEVSPVKGERVHELNKFDSSNSNVEEPGPSSPIKVSEIVDIKPNPLAVEDIKCDKCGYDFLVAQMHWCFTRNGCIMKSSLSLSATCALGLTNTIEN